MKKLDVTGDICPIPVLKTKRALEELKEGEELEVVGDYKPALENIKRFAENNGYKVVSYEETENGFRIVIRK
ncbi:SirA family protein [Methanocaldococcus lauensis]|uniref:SirA family protein n=1 Tax=Methanocaldococcus lauensis TaxID=2546128 RepID=A0A8D6SV82_9EURY|nr:MULTISPECIES: sulfurtransferase TusA family protein [Methanocaldococcus]MCQ6253804.1 sulfurtransferase TusA family protein [Methanocaldococcus sp.]CAB3287565.1 SirA family protein [Methanocaldococcus lauensis]CAB3288133.1 SirA family protein [Methanocaldococcus lauensis]